MKCHHIFRLAIIAVAPLAVVGSEAESHFTGKIPKVTVEVR